ncbi:HIG1 domain member 1A, mitochondrial [Chamberlinius hualienensis]
MSTGTGSVSTWDEIEAKYQTEGRLAKLWRKTKEAPYMPVGILGAAFGIGYGALKFKHRGKMSTSVYLIHMRVAAQGCIVAAVTLGVTYNLLRDYVFNKKEEEETS